MASPPDPAAAPVRHRFRLTEPTVMLLLGGVMGVLGGLGAVAFEYVIETVQGLAFGTTGALLTVLDSTPPWMIVLIPAAGGFLAAGLAVRFAPKAKGHGVPEVMRVVALEGGRLRGRTAFVKVLASAVTLGTGGSAGQEGPVVQIGAAIGSSLGQYLRISRDNLRTLVGCGAAAAIAATFNAPIAGAMFSLEVILAEFGIATFSPIVLASVIATVVARSLEGDHPAFLVPAYGMESPWEIGPYLLLGVLGAVAAVIFTKALYASEDVFARLKQLPVPARAAIGGALVGIIGLFLPQAMGNGYPTIDHVLANPLTINLMCALFAAKIIATSLSLGSGASGGVFAPSLFIGAMMGGAFGQAIHAIFPDLTGTPGAYALVGMGAVVAGTTHAPLTAILMLFELTGTYTIILPLMTSCIMATIIARRINRRNIYTTRLAREGISLEAGREVNVMKGLFVRDAMTKDVESLPEDMSFRDLVRLMTHSRHTTFPVVNTSGEMTGILSFTDIKEVMFEPELADLVVAKELATEDVITVRSDMNLHDALAQVGTRNIEEMPVVAPDNPRKIVGILSRRDIVSAYNKAIRKREEQDEAA